MKKKLYDGFRAKGYKVKQCEDLVKSALEMLKQGMDYDGAIQMAEFDYGVEKSNNNALRSEISNCDINQTDEEGYSYGGVEDMEPSELFTEEAPTIEELIDVKRDPAKCCKLIRSIFGLSQGRLGELLGCSKQMINQVESNHRKAPPELVKKLDSIAEGITVEDL